jgi:ketosteroid isomerase-like protein
MERIGELAAQIRRWYDAFNMADIPRLDDFLSAENGILGIGTDPREWWAGSDAVRAAWSAQLPEMQAAGMRFQPGDLQAFSEESVGWFADQPTLRLPDGSEVPARLTGVCRQENGTWKMIQFHFSFGVMNEEAIGEELTI